MRMPSQTFRPEPSGSSTGGRTEVCCGRLITWVASAAATPASSGVASTS